MDAPGGIVDGLNAQHANLHLHQLALKLTDKGIHILIQVQIGFGKVGPGPPPGTPEQGDLLFLIGI